MPPTDVIQPLQPPVAVRPDPAVLNAVRQKCFVGIIFIGAVSGALPAWFSNTSRAAMFFDGFVGIISVICLGFVGGFLADFTRTAYQAIRSGRVESENDSRDGMIIGILGGTFLGLIIKLVFWAPSEAMLAVTIGAFAGGFIGTLPGDMVSTIVHLLATDGKKTAQRKPGKSTVPMGFSYSSDSSRLDTE